MVNLLDLIAKKRDGGRHTDDEIRLLVAAVADGSMPDYQAAAWLMAAYLRGLSHAETVALTAAMRDSGERIQPGSLPSPSLDKHSSGGVGDKTTLVVVPLLASCGVSMLKMSGRGLGHTGGTIDKLESIPGFRTDLTMAEARAQVGRIGAAIVGQSASVVPADKRLYALRDVTATIDCIPLIAASIMSKKLAGGADSVLLDAKVGRGAFMPNLERARDLAGAMVEIGRESGVRTVAALTAMDEPLGAAVGNRLEVDEACDVLMGRPADGRFRDLCLALAAQGLMMAGAAADADSARKMAARSLAERRAAGKFGEIIAAQGGAWNLVEPSPPSESVKVVEVRSESFGFVTSIDAMAVGTLAMRIGAGRARKEDAIDPDVGIVLAKKTGALVSRGDVLARLHLRPQADAGAAGDALRAAYAMGPHPPDIGPIVLETLA